MLMTVPQSQHLRAIGTQVRVFVDDFDVTHYCAAADDTQGWAVLYVGAVGQTRRTRLHQGKIVPAVMLIEGSVRFGYDLQPQAERLQAQ
jgi:hypothetical protein